MEMARPYFCENEHMEKKPEIKQNLIFPDNQVNKDGGNQPLLLNQVSCNIKQINIIAVDMCI